MAPEGSLIPGADADLVMLDPHEEWVVDPGALVTPAGWSPYSGRALRGRVRRVFARGQELFAGGAVVLAAPAAAGWSGRRRPAEVTHA